MSLSVFVQCSKSAALRGLRSEHWLLLLNFNQDPNLPEKGFVQLIYAKFHKTNFSRFMLICAGRPIL
jgi:hypothetical protein